LVDFPDGGVLVTKKTSPSYARILHKAAAVVAEIGSTTGHLSIIARELGVPTILNLKNASEKLKNGEFVTVDAYRGVVFPGKIEEVTDGVLDESEEVKPFHDTPIYKMISQAAEHVLPLYLTNPQSESFLPQNCKTAHDITRFCHEMAITEMFKLHEAKRQDYGQVRKLEFPIPLEIYVIDLGSGLKVDKESPKVAVDNVQSLPFKAMLNGMNTPGLPWSGPVPMDLRGFAGLIMNTMVDKDRLNRELGSKSYAMISYHYINFSARLGYHFSNLDAYASPFIHRNYISYRFKGGAADSTRRARRAKFISEVLKHYGFHVVQRSDHVHSIVRKLNESEILKLMTNIGRLMGAIRNADVTMYSDEQIELYAQAFLNGSSSPVETVTKNQKNKNQLAKGDE
jgi:pyruvate,water dikinase